MKYLRVVDVRGNAEQDSVVADLSHKLNLAQTERQQVEFKVAGLRKELEELQLELIKEREKDTGGQFKAKFFETRKEL